MNRAPFQQRCWNHEGREAVCLCPVCSRSFCRECVSEHESRLLCARCLQTLSEAAKPRTRAMPRVTLAALALFGFLFTWIVFFSLGEAVMTLSARSEQTLWQDH
jgi:uncharacterized paraquat-inducible protein A